MTQRPATPRWLTGFVIGVVVLTVSAVGLWAVNLPYLVWSPGPVTNAFGIITPEPGVEMYPADGELLVLTVLQNTNVNAWDLAIAAADPTLDVYPRQAVFRAGESNQQYHDRELDAMAQTIQIATEVALSKVDNPPSNIRLQVLTVKGDFPAAQVLDPGDVILSIDGRDVTSIDVLRQALADKAAGDVVTLEIMRGSDTMTVDVALGEITDDSGVTRPAIGVTLGPHPPLDIETNNVGGPSAGLMFTLSLIDLLTPDDLTEGHVIAGTGTISLDGTVGAIGGVRQKIVAAEAAGAEYMFVPQANWDEAQTADRKSMQLVEVASVDEALAFLATLSHT